jgi:hypothetical protein
VAHVILTCDKYKSSLRYVHDPVLLSLKMKDIFLKSTYNTQIHCNHYAEFSNVKPGGRASGGAVG